MYLDPPFVFCFNKLSSGCGLDRASCARRNAGRSVYWMSLGTASLSCPGNGVQEIPCSVWDVVFQDLDTANQSKCVAGPNSQFDEMNFVLSVFVGAEQENATNTSRSTSMTVHGITVRFPVALGLINPFWVNRSGQRRPASSINTRHRLMRMGSR